MPDVRQAGSLRLTRSLSRFVSCSASGASVVAIDNKIEQAMVSVCLGAAGGRAGGERRDGLPGPFALGAAAAAAKPRKVTHTHAHARTWQAAPPFAKAHRCQTRRRTQSENLHLVPSPAPKALGICLMEWPDAHLKGRGGGVTLLLPLPPSQNDQPAICFDSAPFALSGQGQGHHQQAPPPVGPPALGGLSPRLTGDSVSPWQDLVKNHLMYAVREEVEFLKEQIKELVEKNSQLERENSLLKHLASPEQMQKFQSRLPLEVPLPAPDRHSQGGAAPSQHTGGSAV